MIKIHLTYVSSILIIHWIYLANYSSMYGLDMSMRSESKYFVLGPRRRSLGASFVLVDWRVMVF